MRVFRMKLTWPTFRLTTGEFKSIFLSVEKHWMKSAKEARRTPEKTAFSFETQRRFRLKPAKAEQLYGKHSRKNRHRRSGRSEPRFIGLDPGKRRLRSLCLFHGPRGSRYPAACRRGLAPAGHGFIVCEHI